MEYKKIAIIGAGAVGAYCFWGLSKKKDAEVYFIANGERKARLESGGLVINGKQYFPDVRTPENAKDADLIIAAVKYGSLASALTDIKAAAGERTAVMSLMNGVDSEEKIGEAIGEEKMIYSVIKIASERVGNSIRFDPETTIGIIYGEKDGAHSERTAAFGRLFCGTGINCRFSEHIVSEIWCKFLLNITANQPQAIVGCGIGAYDDSRHLAFICDKLGEEVYAVAKAKGIDITLADMRYAKGSKGLPRARYSTLQDLDAKRHTEVDVFAGSMVEMGKSLGVPTPYNEYTYHLIKALEEKNDGLFDYE